MLLVQKGRRLKRAFSLLLNHKNTFQSIFSFIVSFQRKPASSFSQPIQKRNKGMKNNAIWKLKDAETYYELSFVIYMLLFPLAAAASPSLARWRENFSSFHSTATTKMFSLLLFPSESYEETKTFRFWNSTRIIKT